MRLLFDQNLSYRLVGRLGELFPGCAHVRLAGLERASDEAIWEYAKAGGYCIVTQDADFVERVRLYGAPPKVVWVRCGNSSFSRVEALLRGQAGLIGELLKEPGLHYVELF